MAVSDNLNYAKEAKNDEFYTLLADIENELSHYTEHFCDKIVYCNCDNAAWSNFWKYFHVNFKTLGLRELIATHYKPQGTSYKLIYRGEDGSNGVAIPLEGNGDFRSQECQAILDEADIVVTNPPFSLFREYMGILTAHKKKFLIVGNKNAITYKDFFPLLMNNQVWLGYNDIHYFEEPDGSMRRFNNIICWFTNLDTQARHLGLLLTRKYDPSDYPKYDNYDAISVSKVAEIPADYMGTMGVPITFLEKYCPEQFEILGHSGTLAQSITIDGKRKSGRFYLNGKRLYERIVIRRR